MNLEPGASISDTNSTQDLQNYSSSQKPLWQRLKRLGNGAFFVAIGGVAIALGTNSFLYRWQHLVVEHGVLNSRRIPIQAPVDGSLTSFYANPGITIKQGQTLATVQNTLQSEQEDLQALVQIEGEVTNTLSKLAAARQSFGLLQQQLQQLEGQSVAVRSVDTNLQSKLVAERQAEVDAAIAKANAADAEVRRYLRLADQGVVSQQLVDQTRLTATAAAAEVRQARATLDSAQASLRAAEQGVANQAPAVNLLDQRTRLSQSIQAQSALVSTLETQLATLQQQRQQTKGTRETLQEVPVSAPFSGVVYRTYREQGEQVNRGQSLLSLLDCQSLWAEAVVSAADAARINVQQPVLVYLTGSAEPIQGQIELVQPLNPEQTAGGAEESQVWAIAPAVPPSLLGQAVQRITIRIPPPPQYNNPQQFCGVGQPIRLSFRKQR